MDSKLIFIFIISLLFLAVFVSSLNSNFTKSNRIYQNSNFTESDRIYQNPYIVTPQLKYIESENTKCETSDRNMPSGKLPVTYILTESEKQKMLNDFILNESTT
jgi:hypothetical protein